MISKSRLAELQSDRQRGVLPTVKDIKDCLDTLESALKVVDHYRKYEEMSADPKIDFWKVQAQRDLAIGALSPFLQDGESK